MKELKQGAKTKLKETVLSHDIIEEEEITTRSTRISSNHGVQSHFLSVLGALHSPHDIVHKFHL